MRLFFIPRRVRIVAVAVGALDHAILAMDDEFSALMLADLSAGSLRLTLRLTVN